MFLRAFEKVLKIFNSHNRKLLATGSKFPAFPEENKRNEEEKEKREDIKECQSQTDLENIAHTGHVFDKNDYRNVRFLNAKQYANENWGITYSISEKPLEVTDRIVSCDGGESMGHPKFYINLDKPGKHFCCYCGKSFIRKINEFEICSNATLSGTNSSDTTAGTNATFNKTNTTVTEANNIPIEASTTTTTTTTETPCDSPKPEDSL